MTDEWELPDPDPQFVPQSFFDDLAKMKANDYASFPLTWEEDHP